LSDLAAAHGKLDRIIEILGRRTDNGSGNGGAELSPRRTGFRPARPA
jgi:hypothetical protein